MISTSNVGLSYCQDVPPGLGFSSGSEDGEDGEEEDEGDSGGIAITIPMLGSDLDLADNLNKTSPPPRHTLMIVVIIGMETHPCMLIKYGKDGDHFYL